MKILICPLNWGLGHATRCVPIIQKLLSEGHEPVLVSDGFALEFLQQEFPTLRFLEFPSYSIRYSNGNSQITAMLGSFPKIFGGIVKEHLWLKNILKTETFDQIISDNRFGMWNIHIHSIYITHQLMVKMPHGLKFLEPLVWLLHRTIINRYQVCWIPDSKENNGLSGDLAHKYPLPKNAIFIGPLSRFGSMKNILPKKNFDTVAILSGIEPQRSIFENELMKKYQNETTKTLIIKGQPQNTQIQTRLGNITIVSHLTSYEIASYLKGAKKIISRSGYSTIMDLAVLNCLGKAEFIPTPGQTEQEYLSKIHPKVI